MAIILVVGVAASAHRRNVLTTVDETPTPSMQNVSLEQVPTTPDTPGHDPTLTTRPHASTLPAKDSTFNFTTADGRTRSYMVHTPPGLDPSHTYPVLFGFHGGFGTAETFAGSTGFSELADERGFIVVYGQGTSLGVVHAPTWNAGGCCGQSDEGHHNVDDVAYVRAVVAAVEAAFPVNHERIYMTGMSNGSMLVNRLACEAADVFAGAATVSGTIQIKSCTPSKRIPLMIVHGTDDSNVPYDGGKGSTLVNRSTYEPVEQEFTEWAARNGCTGTVTTSSVAPLTLDGKTIDLLSYQHCAARTVLYRINHGIHEWPGGSDQYKNPLERSAPTRAFIASKTIADFFHL
jgi:polyhydroxybutyrate depolymerase